MPAPQNLAVSSPRLFSVNQLKTWSRCRKKYFLDYVNQLHWPTDHQNFQLGQDVHKLLDYHARGLNCEAIIGNATSEVQSAWRLLMADPMVKLPILGSEWGFQVPLTLDGSSNNWLVGRVDRIAQSDDRVLVIDWKTGTAVPKNPENDWQTRVYLYAVYEARQDLGLNERMTPEQFQFIYVEVKDQIRSIPVFYTSLKHEETRQVLRQTVGQIIFETAYSLPETCPDRYCPYENICGINASESIKTHE